MSEVRLQIRWKFIWAKGSKDRMEAVKIQLTLQKIKLVMWRKKTKSLFQYAEKWGRDLKDEGEKC